MSKGSKKKKETTPMRNICPECPFEAEGDYKNVHSSGSMPVLRWKFVRQGPRFGRYRHSPSLSHTWLSDLSDHSPLFYTLGGHHHLFAKKLL